MSLKLNGHIKSVKSTEDAMGDIIHLLTLEVVGDVKELLDYTKKPLAIIIERE